MSQVHNNRHQVKQEAELLHRDRAAGSVSFGAATGGSLYAQNLRLKGRLSPTICERIDGQWMPYNFATEFSDKETL